MAKSKVVPFYPALLYNLNEYVHPNEFVHDNILYNNDNDPDYIVDPFEELEFMMCDNIDDSEDYDENEIDHL